jgi:RHS repeat-associated protein
VHEPGTFVPLLQQEGGEVFLYVNDHLSAPRELLDAMGRVAWSATFSAWGRTVEVHADPSRAGEPKVTSPFRMRGQVIDEDTGLAWTRYRVFDAAVGRFLSPDPIGIHGGLDPFAFPGSPVRVIDPLGLAGKPHSANQLQSEVRRGQAPRDVERVDPPHVPGQQAHVHYTDGTSSNVDGTTHDAHRGQPNPSRRTREWLEGHGWTPPPR